MFCVCCNKPASAACSRCNLTYYCGRECQKQHWSQHKKTCFGGCSKLIESCRAQLLEIVNKKIMGNIYTLASHKYKEFGFGTVIVTIEKTIEEFTTPGLVGSSLQCANLSFIPGGADNTIGITYQFQNYTYNCRENINDIDWFIGLLDGKKNMDKYGMNVWTIFFDI